MGPQFRSTAIAIFYERYVTARQHPKYIQQWKRHQERYA